MICPQHGSIFSGENVGKFLDWLESLEVGKWESNKPVESREAALV
jgi:flavorubredoxin